MVVCHLSWQLIVYMGFEAHLFVPREHGAVQVLLCISFRLTVPCMQVVLIAYGYGHSV